MKFTISGKNIEVTDGLKSAIKDKLGNRFDNVEFKKGIFYEDLNLTPTLVKYTDKIGFIEEGLYYYVQRNNSIMRQNKYNDKCRVVRKVNSNLNTNYTVTEFITILEKKSISGAFSEYRYTYENTIIEDSGILYTNRYEPSRFEYIFKTQPKNEKFYTLTIKYETVNKYSFETKFQLQGLVNILENGININTIDSNINMANITSISQEEEEGRVCLQISGNAETPISLKVRRTDSRTNFSQWEDISAIKNYVSEYTFYDYTIESGVWYKYGVQIEQSDGIRSVLNIIDKPIIRNFNYTFLLGENNQQLKLQFNNTFDSYKININESITNTLGGVFPLVSRSGATYYKTFSLGGLISFNMDENKLFLSDDEIYNFNEVAKLYEEYNLKNNITHYDYNLEREFRNKVITFLNDGKIKLLKSPTEGNILIYLSGVSFSPENSLSRMIYSFSSTATEIARSNIESYKKYKIIKVEED